MFYVQQYGHRVTLLLSDRRTCRPLVGVNGGHLVLQCAMITGGLEAAAAAAVKGSVQVHSPFCDSELGLLFVAVPVVRAHSDAVCSHVQYG